MTSGTEEGARDAPPLTGGQDADARAAESRWQGPPGSWRRFVERWPEVAAAYDVLSDVCRTGGPLAPGQVAIVKLAVSVGRGTPRTVHSHAKKALRAGCDPDVLRQVALVALPTVGLPAMLDALGWIEESIQEERLSAWRSPDDPAVTSR